MNLNDTLLQIDGDYNKSIMSIRAIFSSHQYTTEEKKVIAAKILDKINSMKNEVLPWSI